MLAEVEKLCQGHIGLIALIGPERIAPGIRIDGQHANLGRTLKVQGNILIAHDAYIIGTVLLHIAGVRLPVTVKDGFCG
jgi:hypothetical protein